MKEFTTAVEAVVREDGGEAPEEQFIEFKLDGRTIRAYPPNDGQLAFMVANLGRGMSNQNRFASIINVMLECLDPESRDYLEGRMLTRDPKDALPVAQVEAIFEYLAEEWFGTPTQSPSDSV